jgi:hypothetical protein
VKWVTGIQVLNKESETFWMKSSYRHPGKPVPPGTAVPMDQMKPVTSLRVKSVIASPETGVSVAPNQTLVIAGAAWAGDAAPVTGVEVSVDGGRSWQAAKLGTEQARFGWRLWQFAWTPHDEAFYTVMARARTSAGETQPFDQEWNPSGYGWNVVPRVQVNVTKAVPPPAGAAAATDTHPPDNVRAACLTCHQEDVMTQQHLTRAQWDREINKMTGWGAQVKAEDRESILNYLLTNYGPRK